MRVQTLKNSFTRIFFGKADRVMAPEMDRRTFVKGSMLAGLALAAGGEAQGAAAPAREIVPYTPAPKETMPQGKIGDLKVSRMLLGGNLLTHYTHSRDLKYVYTLCEHYNTEAKILETLAMAEDYGINTMNIHTVPWALDILRKHRKRGGKLQWIICPTANMVEGLSEFNKMVQELADNGTDAIYIWGVHADPLVAAGKIGIIREAIDMIKAAGVPAGVGAHDLNVIEACEKNKIPAEFYIKTFHHHHYPTGPKPEELKTPYAEIPGYWCKDPKRTIEVMKQVKKPWIAFKVMAAGAIPPADAFKYVFENGADFTLAGMFDYEIAPDTKILRDLFAGGIKRERPWFS